jgi:hypothetical protein
MKAIVEQTLQKSMEDQLYEEAVSSTEANVYKNLKNTTVRGS